MAQEPQDFQREWLAKLPPEELANLQYRWDFWARPDQLHPPGDWSTWLILCGRGWGKTRTGSEWIRSQVCGKTPLSSGPGKHRFVALCGETASDCRDVLVEGPAGIKAVHPKEFCPIYEPSKRRLTWPNGCMATLYNGSEPDQLRGPQHSLAWCDELAKYRYIQEFYDMLSFGLRLGDDPRLLITTTPRPLKLIKSLVENSVSDNPSVVVTRGSLFDNRANLPPKRVQEIRERYEGTRLGRQELYGEILEDVPGAMFNRSVFDAHRVKKGQPLPDMRRIVVAIDPAAKPSEDDSFRHSETGLVIAGLGVDGRGYIIDDRSCRLDPDGWARVAIQAYDHYEADFIVAEQNMGGSMVEAVIRANLKSLQRSISVKLVHATRGKVVRAEPISALYEQGRISHISSFPVLEDQLVMFTPWGIEGDQGSDRADALVWALTELFPALVAKENRPDKGERYDNVMQSDRSQITGY